MTDFTMNSEGFGLKIYDHFPPRYHEDDANNRFALRRYLDACGDGGFKHGIDEWNGILNFADPDQASSQVLPILYEQYGLPLFNGIPEQYLRYLLPRLGRAWQKKGGLDVIEFVSSALVGVKASTIVTNDMDSNVDIILRLEMNYALSDYFPDTKQLRRLLERFLPFYLGLSVVYIYIFHDKSDIHGESSCLDVVTYTTKESGSFYYSGRIPSPMLSPPSLHYLNTDFILNYYDEVAPDPDPVWENISIKCQENGSLAHRIALSPFNVEVDKHLDKVIYAPVIDTPILRVAHEGNKDCLGFNHCEQGLVCGSEDSSLNIQSASKENGSLVHMDKHLDKVTCAPITEIITPKVAHDENTDHLNTNSSEKGITRGTDESSFNIHGSTTESTTFVVNPFLCMITNIPGSVLNNARLRLPDEIDIIQYRDGSVQPVFR